MASKETSACQESVKDRGDAGKLQENGGQKGSEEFNNNEPAKCSKEEKKHPDSGSEACTNAPKELKQSSVDNQPLKDQSHVGDSPMDISPVGDSPMDISPVGDTSTNGSHTNKPTPERTPTIKFHVMCPEEKHDKDVTLILLGRRSECEIPVTMQKKRSYGKFTEYQCFSDVLPFDEFDYRMVIGSSRSYKMPLVILPEKDVNKQYHAFIEDCFWNKVSSAFSNYHPNIPKMARIFLEKILFKITELQPQEVWSMGEIIEDVGHIFTCLDPSGKYKKEFSDAFIEVLMMNLEKQSGNEKKFFLAYLVIEACVWLNVDVRGKCSVLCENLMVISEPSKWEEIFRKHFQFNERNGGKIREMCKKCARDGDPNWLFCIPLIHFHFNEIKPFEKHPYRFDIKAWWGVDHIQDIINTYQNSSGYFKIAPILKKLKKFYPMDTLLPQTVVAALKPQQFKDSLNGKSLSLDACLGRIRHELLNNCYEEKYDALMKSIMMKIISEEDTGVDQCRGILIDHLKIATQKKYVNAIPNILHVWFKTLPKTETQFINETINAVVSCLEETKVKLADFFKVCDRLLIACSEEDVWKEKIKETLWKKIARVQPNVLMNAFHEVHSTIEPDMMHILCRYSMDIVSQSEPLGPQLISLFSKIFSHNWPQTADQSVLISYILQWTSFKDLVSNYQSDKTQFSRDCQRAIMDGIKTFMYFIEVFETGDITVLMLNTALEKEMEVKALVKIIDPKKQIEKSMKDRKLEKSLYLETQKQIECLLGIAVPFKMVGYEDLMKKLETNIEQYSWKDICDSQNGEPIIKYYEIPTDLKENLKTIEKLSHSKIFDKIMIQKENENLETDLSNINHKIFEPTLEIWNQYCRQLEDGSLTFEDIDKLFEFSNPEQISAELKMMINTSHLSKVQIQIQRFKISKTPKEALDLVIQMRDELKLQGSFKTIDAAWNIAQRNGVLEDLDENVCKELAFLDEYTEEKLECLKKFLECKELRSWITENIADLKALGVLVDLATISAGEGDLELEKVMCLHSCVIGYGPLIFNVTNEMSFETLDSRFKEVWNAFAQDRNLPKKLEDTQCELDWLNTVKHTQGSVEISSISLAQKINNAGIYYIRASDQGTQDLDSIIRVTILEKDEKEKQLSFKEVTDLQSRLMLVVGKAGQENNDVKDFSDVFDSITHLGKAFLKLYETGNILYQYMSIVCFTSPDTPTSILVNFPDMEEQLKCEKKTGESITQQIGNISSFFERCQSPWADYIEKNRVKWYDLNNYTIHQISFLQKEIASFKKDQNMNHLVYPLLSAVKRYCSPNDVLKALKEAEKTVKEDSVKKQCTQFEDEEPTQKFIQEILDAEFTIEDALEALKHFRIDQIDEVMIWLMEKTDSGGEEEKDKERSDLWSNLSKEISLKGTSKNLIENLEQIWEKFMTAATLDHANIISVEHLGIILHHLSDISSIRRTFSTLFKEGQPNLVVCSQDNVLYTTMSVYMESKAQPLPQADEVLFCTKDTTVEQVDIFIKRAMIYKDKNKIYCMMYTDLLSYEASDVVERKLHKYLNFCLDYKLVIICSEESEYKCRIAAALGKFRSPYKCMFQPKEIKDYIENKLQNENIPEGINPAYKIDVANSSVRLITSWRCGCGKTLYKNTLAAKLRELNGEYEEFCISLYEHEINTDRIMKSILPLTDQPNEKKVRLFHFDIALQVKEGVDHLLFNLLILGQLVDDHGFVWLRQPYDIYLVETLSLAQEKEQDNSKVSFLHQILEILPDITCRTPKEALLHYEEKCFDEKDQFFHDQKFYSEQFQRTFAYLKPPEQNVQKSDCLEVILRYCGIDDPTWSQLTHFVKFFNIQLKDIENSIFCNQTDMFFGFREFVLKFLLRMSQDFANVTLNLSEESSDIQPNEDDRIERFQLRRRWETTPHPYLFFNDDQRTMTFLGFKIEKRTGNLLDPHTNQILEPNIMKNVLYEELHENGAPLNENFDGLCRIDKIRRLCHVMGVKEIHDPDPTYELTTDNVKKMLAIYMRFRCDIPVVVMGETGCGKTRLIKFMCQLQIPPESDIQNLVIMKVHGGTTRQDIINKINKTIELSNENAETVKSLKTILFFDEANTTEAIGMIKDIMCDKIIDGKPFDKVEHLKIVAACNPYRKHSQEMIEHLQQAGLGYNIDDKMTTDKFGQIPMRHLVYRVKPLPPSMLSLVWDFGQLDKETEQLYIIQMVASHNEDNQWDEQAIQTISKILVESQFYMRKQENECSFVSLRNVERTLNVMDWFSKQSILHEQGDESIDVTTRSLILALSVCYHSSLQNRAEYREYICQFFDDPCYLPEEEDQMLEEINKCQDIILSHVQLESTVAKNQALLENVFMMTVCIELRIPLFLVGKPGSSKSLAKTIVANAMQGKRAQTEFFKQMKQAQMISFQCSPLSTTEGILSVFSQGTQFQKSQDLNNFVSVVVLDEIGLAEDSPKMPLKVLHPLIEDGCIGDEQYEPYKKVAFIGISNWALDPAKMNRGISVQRDVPGIEELVSTAKGICSSNKDVEEDLKQDVLLKIGDIFEPVARAYTNLLTEAANERREFFGLRDFYSMVKMIFAFAKEGELTWPQLAYAIKRNFGGLDCIEPLEEFKDQLKDIFDVTEENHQFSCSTTSMIETCLVKDAGSERRYLLLLMENFTDLNMIKQYILSSVEATMIFGSSFPHDQLYTKVCRNINKIKICMEMGKTVILLNLENLYESLYDALNQFYVYFGGVKFVDLGLGTHRIKCKVNDNFRLIVIAEKEVVYAKFPIPLINRLEKHYLTLSSFLKKAEEDLVNEIKERLRLIIDESEWKTSFVGFTESSLVAIVLHVCRTMEYQPSEENSEIIYIVETILLKIATPDAIVRIYKNKTTESRRIAYTYFNEQKHDNITDFLVYNLEDNYYLSPFSQITTYNKMLSKIDSKEISDALQIEEKQIVFLNLEAFDTEQQFKDQVRHFFETGVHKKQLLIIQCLSVDSCLIVNSQNIIQDEFDQVLEMNQDLRKNIKVFFIIQLCILEESSFGGFQVGAWQSFHIDDLHKPPINMPPVITMMDKSFEDLFENSISQNCEEQSLDVRKLLNDCIPAAVSSIKNGGSERAIQRINMLNNLLEDEEFADGLLCQISASLKRKMNNSPDSKHWLLEQTENENRIKFGAFGNMILQCMKQKITSHLADIISAVDIYSNLDIPNGDNELKRKLWVTLFKDKKIIEAASFPMYKQELKISMPFFWIFFQIIKNFQADQLKTGVETSLVSLVKENSFFRELEKFAFEFLKTDDRISFLRDYLRDFINMTHEHISQSHSEILQNQLMYAIKQLYLPWDESDMTTSMVSIHEAFSKMEFRFQNFSCMVGLNPQIINELTTKCTNEEEMTMDVVALDLLLEQLEPKKLDEEDGRREWIKSVLDHLPCVMPILKTEIQNDIIYGESCWSSIKGIKSSWTKIMAVKLFIHHMNPSKISGIKNGIKLCRPLWSILQNDADMKTIKSFEKIEKFLKTCNKNAMKQLQNTFIKCSICGKEIEDASVKLPCLCISCKDCIKINSKCFKCNIPLPDDFQPDFEENNREALDKYETYRDACNGFFMELISQLCFSDGCPPSKEVFDKLMDYILKVNPKSEERRIITKEISVSDDAIDPTPLLRSFLFQLLMQARKEDSDRRLEEYVERIRTEMGDEKSFFKLTIILIIHCFEDDLLRSTEKGAELDDAIEALKSYIVSQGNMGGLSLDKMHSLASVRFGLVICAKYMYKYFVEGTYSIEHRLDQLLLLAEKVCTMQNTTLPKFFLLKILVHSYGQHAYQKITEHCPWAIPFEKQDENVIVASDYFIVWGEDYTKLRDNFASLKLGHGSSLDRITEIFEEEEEEEEENTVINTVLAIYKEITCSPLYPEKQRMSEMHIERIEEICNQYDTLNIDIITDLFRNRFGRNSPQLKVKENLDVNDQGFIAMLLHYYVVLMNSDQKHFFRHILENPAALKDSFFPAMPGDITYETSEMIRTRNAESRLEDTLNECPNGHIYIIGECGRPAVRSSCPQCGAEIGGADHVHSAGNKISDGRDKSQRGYILEQGNESDIIHIERDMDRTSTVLMRLFLHSSMFLSAANEDPQVISEMIDKLDEDVFDFLKEHIFNDLRELSKVLGKNIDDIFLLINFIIKQMITNMPGFDVNESALKSKHDRRSWEKKFSEIYFKPHILNMETILDEYKRKISADKNNANNILLSLSSSFHNLSDDTPLNEIENEIQLWQYRPHITMEHFKTKLTNETINEEARQKLSILDTFFNMDRQLFAVRFIPDIIKLHSTLLRKFQHKLGFQQAKDLTIQDVLDRIDSVSVREELSSLVDSFIQAWNDVRSDLKKFVCTYQKSPLTEHQEHCDGRLFYGSQLAYFIPCNKGPGVCAYALLKFLINQHNDFMNRYNAKIDERNLSEMPLSEVRQIHVIDFDPNRDFYFLILPNCNYKFSLNVHMIIEYNFMGFQHQLEDRFLNGKVKIKQQQFETIIFRGDISNIPLFEKLCEKIKQAPIPKCEKKQISQELKDLTRVYADLENLETIILFLINNSGDHEIKISAFMSNILQMKTEFSSSKVNEFCELQHAKSLWFLLNMKIEKLLAPTKLSKTKFETVKNDFKADLSEDERSELIAIFETMGNELLDDFISILFEFIFCYLPQLGKNVVGHSLKENLEVYLEDNDITLNIRAFLDEIKVENTVATWTLAVEVHNNLEEM